MKTDLEVKRVETESKYYPIYHITFDDYRGKHTIKIDESTARLLTEKLDKAVNWTQKV